MSSGMLLSSGRHLLCLALEVGHEVFERLDAGREHVAEAVHELAEVLFGRTAAHVLRRAAH